MILRDNIHFSSREVDGYGKPFITIISEREAGKSTDIIMKIYNAFKRNGETSIVLRRLINDITETYIDDMANVINKFTDDHVVLEYAKKGLKEGIVNVKIEGILFFRVIALSNPVSRMKSLMLPDLRYMIFDEFICNPAFKEKYLPDEATRFKELYNTFQRESSKLTCYFLGNPYSKYNPYFVWWGVDTNSLKSGTIQSGSNWVVQAYKIKDELKELILKRNPLYQFDDAYKRYAFDGESINDANIRVAELPENYALKFVFKIEGKYIGVFQNNYWEEQQDKYHCQFISTLSARRIAYCFDFGELLEGTAMIGREEKSKFNRFKIAMRNRNITFSSIEVYYLIEEVYYNL